jgi:hypothetical protein
MTHMLWAGLYLERVLSVVGLNLFYIIHQSLAYFILACYIISFTLWGLGQVTCLLYFIDHGWWGGGVTPLA